MNNMISLLFPFVLMIGLMYLMVFRPENKRKKQYQSMLDSLSVNDEIMTRGGILGKVINIIESGPDRVRLKFTRTAIGDVLTKKEEPAKEN